MMNLGAPEMLLLGIIALLLFGPRRLPELGKALGEGLAAFRESSRQLSGEFKRQLEEETTNPVAPPVAMLGTPMVTTSTTTEELPVLTAEESDLQPTSLPQPASAAAEVV